MAFVAGLAMGAAAASGVALGASCVHSPRWEGVRLALLHSLGGTPCDPTNNASDPSPSDGRATTGRRGSKVRAEDGSAEEVPTISGWQGFSMEEARLHANDKQARALARSPQEVLAELQRGNARFWMNCATRPEKSAFERRALISKQFPSVAILGCSDSRVPTEIIFDQGLGDIFVIRVAGNCLDTATLASLQYAVYHLKVKVLVVLGHEMCGAVKAAMLPQEQLEQEPAQLEQVLKNIKFGLEQDRLQFVKDSRAHDREAVTTNVKEQVERLKRDKGIMTKVRADALIVVGAFYEISSGIVDFFVD